MLGWSNVGQDHVLIFIEMKNYKTKFDDERRTVYAISNDNEWLKIVVDFEKNRIYKFYGSPDKMERINFENQNFNEYKEIIDNFFKECK